MSESDIMLRKPRLEDGKRVHRLIADCPPLDLNSSYNYFLLCSHFAQTCVIGENNGEIASFLSGYRLPEHPERLFVWQVAVDARFRGQGLAGRMLRNLLSRASCKGVEYIETTVSPSNTASRQVFERFAQQHAADFQSRVFLTKGNFGEEDHEEEILLQIGPLRNEGDSNAYI